MTTPINVNQIFLPSALQIGPGGELITFDAGGNPVVFDPSVPGSITINAVDVVYDNTTSGLTATDVQAAIDEIDATVDGIVGGATDFISLTDTPASYAGQALLFARVNAGETGLEFVAGSLTDTPVSYAGQGLQGVRVNAGETDLEFYNTGLVDMTEDIFVDGGDYTAGGGGPDSFALSANHGSNVANVWVSFDGTDQFDGFVLSGTNDIDFAGGIPALVSQVRVKVGSTTASTFDIDALPAALPSAADILAFSGASVGGTESQATFTQLKDLLATIGGTTSIAIRGVQSFTSSGVYNKTAGTAAVLVICTGAGGAGEQDPSGGSSSFGAFCSATGGGGGDVGGVSGRGGVGTGGIANIYGGDGLVSYGADSGAHSHGGGNGGASFWGGGGSGGGRGNASLHEGRAYGSGGGGFWKSAGGGDGSQGGGAGGTAIDFITGGVTGVAVTVGTGGVGTQAESGANGFVLVIEFG
jgi:hypothetical protein